MDKFRQVFVIQSRDNGLFVMVDMGYSRSLRLAGRLTDYEEALDTGFSAFGEDFEIFSFYEKVKANDART